MTLSAILPLVLFLLLSTAISQPLAAIAYPGNLFFAAQSINSINKVDTLQKANNQFSNHVDSESGNTAIQKLLVVDKNHANQEANNAGYQNAVAKNNAFQQRNSNLGVSGAVLAPWIGRHLLKTGGCYGGGCGGPLVPSSLLATKKKLNAENAANTYNEANQGQAADAHQHADTHHRVKSDIIQNGYANANAKSKAEANALSKSNFFSNQNANEAQEAIANPGLFLRY